MKKVNVGGIKVGGGEPFVLIAGPCVIESEKLARKVARSLKEMTAELGIPFIFKASYDKANRTSLSSYRGPGLAEGLRILYGGSVKPDNAAELFAEAELDGALVGGASLAPATFVPIVRAAAVGAGVA